MAVVPLVETTLGIDSPLAKQVISGLAGPNPRYERVGGVIRNVDNKQIVAWLRSVDASDAARTTVPLSPVHTMAQLATVAQVAVVSVAAVNSAFVAQKLAKIEDQLSSISHKLDQLNVKADAYLDGRLHSALVNTDDALSMNSHQERLLAARTGYKSFTQLEKELDGLLFSEANLSVDDQFMLFEHLALTQICGTVCCLQMEELGTAIKLAKRVQDRLERHFAVCLIIFSAIG